MCACVGVCIFVLPFMCAKAVEIEKRIERRSQNKRLKIHNLSSGCLCRWPCEG